MKIKISASMDDIVNDDDNNNGTCTSNGGISGGIDLKINTTSIDQSRDLTISAISIDTKDNTRDEVYDDYDDDNNNDNNDDNEDNDDDDDDDDDGESIDPDYYRHRFNPDDETDSDTSEGPELQIKQPQPISNMGIKINVDNRIINNGDDDEYTTTNGLPTMTKFAHGYGTPLEMDNKINSTL
eukprot:CAMPEP_0114670980 /NCGR_PEP_ID=MMETSP0191-20121206/40359_1 /TAXON_ID=126664 /ORGANISM="Sorites sp." /LENGTH=182 /DNA_ID=CAMNT_0001929683 /DNA_START=1283 /DNA_END=1832 /DNA_ORIENTATION=-